MAAPQTAVPATDDELVDRLRAGDRAAFDSLYERYLTRVYAFVAKRRLTRAASEALVTEVLANVFSSLDAYGGRTPFAAWVFGITRQTVARRLGEEALGEGKAAGVPQQARDQRAARERRTGR